jgi:hypothetical protein
MSRPFVAPILAAVLVSFPSTAGAAEPVPADELRVLEGWVKPGRT